MKKLLSITLIVVSFLCGISCTKESADVSSALNSNSVSNAKKAALTLVGRQQQITAPTGDYTYPTSQALLWLPTNYSTSKTAYPLIIDLVGTGENGTNINSLLGTQNLPWRISQGWNATAVNPVNKTNYNFIVFTPQCPVQWGWSAPHVKTMLAYLKANYRIDATRVYITGYSAGGWGLWSCITDDTTLCKQFAAIAPVSTASADHPNNIPNVDKYKIACWDICGTADAFYSNAVNYTNIINSNKPTIPAILTGIQGEGHSAWVQAYDSTWRINGKNLFEWFLQYHK